MNKQDKIDKIYKEIANKELSFGCIMYSPIAWNRFTLIDKNKFIVRVAYIEKILELNWQEEVIWHPVLYGDIIDWLEKNLPKTDDSKQYYEWTENYDIMEENDRIYSFVDNSWENKRLPIEEQSELCISYIYNLIKEWTKEKN